MSPGGNNYRNGYHLLHSYCVPGTVLSALHELCHLILTIILKNKDQYFPLLKMRKLKLQKVTCKRSNQDGVEGTCCAHLL